MRRPASNCKNDCSCAWAKRMSNYSDDTFGMNCPGTVLQTVYNGIHPPSDDKMLGAISFEEIAALGCAGPPVNFPRKTRSDYFSSGRLELSISAR
jgi:hypothetical protein